MEKSVGQEINVVISDMSLYPTSLYPKAYCIQSTHTSKAVHAGKVVGDYMFLVFEVALDQFIPPLWSKRSPCCLCSFVTDTLHSQSKKSVCHLLLHPFQHFQYQQ